MYGYWLEWAITAGESGLQMDILFLGLIKCHLSIYLSILPTPWSKYSRPDYTDIVHWRQCSTGSPYPDLDNEGQDATADT